MSAAARCSGMTAPGQSLKVLPVARDREDCPMLQLIWIISIRIRVFMRRYFPTNVLLDAIRTCQGLKWGPPATLLALPYAYSAHLCTMLAESGGSAGSISLPSPARGMAASSSASARSASPGSPPPGWTSTVPAACKPARTRPARPAARSETAARTLQP
jgi:hypothetical protein